MDTERYPHYFLAVIVLYGIVFLAGLGLFILPSLSFGLAYGDFYLITALIFLPLVLLAAFASAIFVVVGQAQRQTQDIRSQAKAKQVKCKSTEVYCGATDSCMSYTACVNAGKPKSTPKSTSGGASTPTPKKGSSSSTGPE